MSERPSDKPTIVDAREGRAPSLEDMAPLFPQLEILEVLGQGGMGVVYKARQRGLDRVVALKVLPKDAGSDPTFAERFGREARALARLQHPNIVTIHDSGQADGMYYFVMEFIDGMDLRRMMGSGQLAPDQALAIVPRICEALQYAHDEGVMHRDIKPENILVDTKGRVKIADFGLAKLIAAPEGHRTLTAPQQVMGTMHYMAPEQVERPGEVDHRADLYALGVVIYEMLTGELPIGRFPLPSERAPVDHRLDQIVLHALEKEPGRRYQHAGQIKTDFERLSGTWAGPGAMPNAVAATPSSFMTAAPGPGSAHGTATTPAYATPTPAMSRATPATGWPTGSGPVFAPAEKSLALAYLLWLACFLGGFGIHRLYAGRFITGIIWLLTGGLLFIGQIVDLILLPGMIRMANLERALIARQMRQP
ncbi:MAG: protein kinase [Planctomycetes bacterium]|nr:protein kinase [Planctomycetota bacterium]